MKRIFYEWYKAAEAHIYKTSPAQEYAKEDFGQTGRRSSNCIIFLPVAINVYDTTLDWFKREEIPYDHIELVGSHHKIETAKKFGVHAFFEDKHDNAVEIHEELDIPVILFDTPYNRKPIPEGVIRVQ